MSRATRTKLKAAIVLCAVIAIGSQRVLDPLVAEMNKGQKTAWQGFSTEFILGPLLGLQQAVAGLLWVRADEFFHEGDYDAILPIVRMVTWLDPHNLDVYITGGWHLAYNFTDSSERSDRRYLPAAQLLLEEGDFNNQDVYEIAFELAWQNTDKWKNYGRAEYWLRECLKRKATDDNGVPNRKPPMFVWHQLAHTLEREGRIKECIEVWKEALAQSEVKYKAKPDDFTTRSVRDSERHNLLLTLKRLYSRSVHDIDFKVDAARTKQINMETGEPSPIDACLETSGPNAGKLKPPSTVPPYNVAFDGTPTFDDPKVLVPKGQFAIADGARVTIRLHDYDWRQGITSLDPMDLIHPDRFLAAVRAGTDPVSGYIKGRLTPATRAQLDAYSGSGVPPADLVSNVVDDVNNIIAGPMIYDRDRFAKVNLSEETTRWIVRHPFGDYLARLNRNLLEDAYPRDIKASPREFSFDVNPTTTLMFDQHSVRADTWGRKIDMSKDPKIYNFSKPYYYLVFEFLPRGTSPYIQDRIGWSGEGMTDKPSRLVTDKAADPPFRLVRKVYKLSKAQIDGAQKITEADVVPNEVYDRLMRQID